MKSSTQTFNMKNTLQYTRIKNLSQYKKYCDRHEELMLRNEEKHAEEIDLLELLIEDYDQKIIQTKNDALNPVELLRSLLRDTSMPQSELATSIQVSKQLIRMYWLIGETSVRKWF